MRKITKEYALPRFREVVDSALEQKPSATTNILKIWERISDIPEESRFWERSASAICTLTIDRDLETMAVLLRNAFLMVRSGEAK